MKQLFTFLLLSTVILTSCRKNRVDPDIKQHDQQEIEKYIQANGLSSVMQRDTSDGDTAGMYYQILNEGNIDSPRIEYSDRLAMVYTIRSFDGKYISADTILNHYSGYLGQFSSLGLPKGLQSGIYNILKHKGGRMRLLIPSRMAYGVNGFGSGSSGNVGGRIEGNQCLDYYVNIVDKQEVYDDLAIQKYMTANSLSGYSKSSTGLYYKISGPDTGKLIPEFSTMVANYKLRYLNNTVVQETTDFTSTLESLVSGVKEGLTLTKTGQNISMILPSRLGYGQLANSSGIPAFTCLRFEFDVKSFTAN